MAYVEVVDSLYQKISKQFKAESVKVLQYLKALEENPKKGKVLGTVGGILIKELKYRNFRFYFIVDGHKMKFLSVDDLTDLLLRFVRMSDKKHQQKTINEIKNILKIIGPKGFK
ncbi:hypothetical protein GOV09_05145 [Candidatus Woesearchaeota archaeon]|nr:hypothetical protein [Candidatus Woesearchaeota archaeon]